MEKKMPAKKDVVHIKVDPGRVSGSGMVKASEVLRQMDSPPKAVIVQGARSYRAFRKAFGEIAEEEARRAYLDTIDRAITAKATDTSSWASLYEAADFMREHEEFWKELGFAKFEDYWRDRVADYFADWQELESAYNYAVMACPKLFTTPAFVVLKMLGPARNRSKRV